MPTMNFFVLTPAERDIAVTLNGPTAAIFPRAVDNASPGIGLNLNDQAINYDPGDPIALTGTLVAPKRIVDDPMYIEQCPDMIDYLLTLPFAALEPETIFAPEV